MHGIIPCGSALGYDTMLSLRSFGLRVVPQAAAEERSRQNEQVHCSQVRSVNPLYSAHFAWESGSYKWALICTIYWTRKSGVSSSAGIHIQTTLLIVRDYHVKDL
jgi:hypothetical protein